jgi:methyltransferase
MAAVTSGPYRWVRHPNYLAVSIEMAALPLVHTAWVTALVWSLANALVLRRRIAAEEAALREASDYDGAMAGRGALLPRRPAPAAGGCSTRRDPGRRCHHRKRDR